MAVTIGVIGDFNPSSPSHAATNSALKDAAAALNIQVGIEWVPTTSLERSESGERVGQPTSILELLNGYDALFAAPGSPYRSMEGALNAIRFARERGLPFTGT